MTGADTRLSRQPRLRPDLLFSRELYRGPAAVFLVKDARSGNAYEIAAREAFVLRRLDGVRTLEQIGEEYAQRFGRRLGDAHWSRLLWLLHQRDLLQVPGRAAAATRPAAGQGPDRAPGIGRPPLIDRWAGALGGIANRWTLAAAVLVVLAVPALVAWDLRDVWDAASPVRTSAWMIAAVVVLVWLSAAGHELAHGLAARHFGCAVTKLNLLTLRCKVEDYLYLTSRTAQVLIAAAGALANGLFLVPFAVAWLVLPPDTGAGAVVAAYLIAGSVQTLINFVPLAPLDGYKICRHALGMVDLAAESRRFLRTLPRQLIRAGARYPAPAAARLSLYGLCWLALVGALGTGVVIGIGGAVQPRLGPAGYYAVAAVVGLTVAGWLARPTHRPKTGAGDRAGGSARSRREARP